MPAETMVLDASAAASILFDEPPGHALDQAIEGCYLTAPTLLPYELARVALKIMDLRPGQGPGIDATLRQLARLPVELVAVPPEEIVRTAERHGISAYDAAYLWLAAEVGGRLVTLDRHLATAAERAGLRPLIWPVR